MLRLLLIKISCSKITSNWSFCGVWWGMSTTIWVRRGKWRSLKIL